MQSRRAALRLLGQGLLLASAACGSSPLWAARRAKGMAALLVPLTGERSALGRSIADAATLAETDVAALRILDTGGTPAGAVRAAQGAVQAGARLLLGPLTAAETRAVAQAVGARVPVLALTNDAGARGQGAFVLGITPGQATQALLGYARSRGVRRVLVLDDAGAWSSGCAAAARAAEGDLGLSVQVLRALPGVIQADALFVPGGSAATLAAAQGARAAGVQLLATMQALDYRPEAMAALEGAWIASPDPERFATFATAFAARNGGRPGAIAALGHDAAFIARALRESDAATREGVLREAGFDCTTGPLRFRSDGSCARDFAILVAKAGQYEKVAESRGA
ncbi:penicillin-binding protein activator [Sphingomonas sp. VNH70]|uniref:penicillin-binding protein activator n=1 Tax=Sphingomonas silueang TaxID=3156617 RepID=UPI0032B4A874